MFIMQVLFRMQTSLSNITVQLIFEDRVRPLAAMNFENPGLEASCLYPGLPYHPYF